MSDFTCVHGSADQCLICGFYMIDGHKINYREIEKFGATTGSEVRFLEHIQRQSVTAFFHKGKIYIPSRQGRSVPLAVGLQWGVWQAQQIEIDKLKKQVNAVQGVLDCAMIAPKEVFMYADRIQKALQDGNNSREV